MVWDKNNTKKISNRTNEFHNKKVSFHNIKVRYRLSFSDRLNISIDKEVMLCESLSVMMKF